MNEHLIVGLMSGLMALMLFLLSMLIKRAINYPHKWEYRNPSDRTCKICGRREVEHYWAGFPEQSWWEVFDEGNEIAHHKIKSK